MADYTNNLEFVPITFSITGGDGDTGPTTGLLGRCRAVNWTETVDIDPEMLQVGGLFPVPLIRNFETLPIVEISAYSLLDAGVKFQGLYHSIVLDYARTKAVAPQTTANDPVYPGIDGDHLEIDIEGFGLNNPWMIGQEQNVRSDVLFRLMCQEITVKSGSSTLWKMTQSTIEHGSTEYGNSIAKAIGIVA